MSYRVMTREEHLGPAGPKRILALDGGGLRGILTLRLLAKIEDLLRKRHGNSPDFRLCHYFDLMAGTSTGAIIAAGLAKGMTTEYLTEKYMELGVRVFAKSWFRLGLFRARYDKKKLVEELQGLFDESTLLGGDELKTGLLVVTKRMDTGSPWPLGNAEGKYSRPREGSTSIPNFNYPLWQVVRASTAAPVFFKPESIRIAEESGKKPVDGQFVDGGVSPHNNPAMQALMYATIKGYRKDQSSTWKTGADQLLITSVGTGQLDPSKDQTRIAAKHGVTALMGLMDDCATLVETMMQWMSRYPDGRKIDGELGNLEHDDFAGQPLITYRRFDVPLSPDLAAMDRPENMNALAALGDGAKLVTEADFPPGFDLPSG